MSTAVEARWVRLEALIGRADIDGIADVLEGLPEPERRALAVPLKAHERLLRDWGTSLPDGDPVAGRWPARVAASVAGAGCVSGAAALAGWLARAELMDMYAPDLTLSRVERYGRPHRRIDVVAAIVEILRGRGLPWLPDLARRLAGRLSTREGDTHAWRLTNTLVTITGIDPPATDGYLLGWATTYPTRPDDAMAMIRGCPGHAAIAPRLFDVERVGGLFWGGWPTALATLAAEGTVDREALIDACLGALQRGGRPGQVRGFLSAHEALAPDLDEVAARARDYAALLPAALSTVAAAAQRQLRGLDDAGRLSDEIFEDASRAVLMRPEKKLVRAQFAWLRAAGRRGRAPLVAPLAATAFTQRSADLQRTALELAIAFATDDQRAELGEAAAALPADLRSEAAAAFGIAAPPSPATEPVMVPPAWSPPPPPAPIASPDELAEALAGLGQRDFDDPVLGERVLAALVSFACADRDALRTGLQPILTRYGITADGEAAPSGSPYWGQVTRGFAPIIVAAVSSREERRSPRGVLRRLLRAMATAVTERGFDPSSRPEDVPAPQRVLRMRMLEIAAGLARDPRPMLVSTPTAAGGLIDPGILRDRLDQAASAGWSPWECDLELALARLPAEDQAELTEHARGLSLPVGGRLTAELSAPPDGPFAYDYFARHQRRWWTTLLPADRERVAAHLLPTFITDAGSGPFDGELLRLLAEADGPSGPALSLAMARGLGAPERPDRALAVDALLVLAARGGFGWEVLGGALAGAGLPLVRVVPALRDLAQAGAWRQVWTVLAAALPPLLSRRGLPAPPRLSDLMALAVEVAEVVRPPGPVPGLREVAGRGGSSRVVAEAGRLTRMFA